MYRFRDIAGYLSKVADFDTPHLSDVIKTTRFKIKAKTKTEGHKTKTIGVGPITTYSLPTVNEIIFYTTIFYNLCILSTS